MCKIPLSLQDLDLHDCFDSMRVRKGYIRVSTEEQNPQLQYDALHAAGFKPGEIYCDIESGTHTCRVAYTRLIEAIQRDVVSEVWVWKMDRLGRDPKELLNFFWLCDEYRVEVVSITESFVKNRNKTPGDFLIWWISVGLSVFELLTLKMRQRAGIEAAKAAGKHLGRPRKIMGISTNP